MLSFVAGLGIKKHVFLANRFDKLLDMYANDFLLHTIYKQKQLKTSSTPNRSEEAPSKSGIANQLIHTYISLKTKLYQNIFV